MYMLDISADLGQKCRKARQDANISLRRAAKEMGYSPAAVSRFERGEIYRINPDMIVWYRDNTSIFYKGENNDS